MSRELRMPTELQQLETKLPWPALPLGLVAGKPNAQTQSAQNFTKTLSKLAWCIFHLCIKGEKGRVCLACPHMVMCETCLVHGLANLRVRRRDRSRTRDATPSAHPRRRRQLFGDGPFILFKVSLRNMLLPNSRARRLEASRPGGTGIPAAARRPAPRRGRSAQRTRGAHGGRTAHRYYRTMR